MRCEQAGGPGYSNASSRRLANSQKAQFFMPDAQRVRSVKTWAFLSLTAAKGNR